MLRARGKILHSEGFSGRRHDAYNPSLIPGKKRRKKKKKTKKGGEGMEVKKEQNRRDKKKGGTCPEEHGSIW